VITAVRYFGPAPPGDCQLVAVGPKNSAFIAINPRSFAGTPSSAKMAWTGQTDTQTAQSMHSSGWMYIMRPPS
jgi:hypothetical protein